MTAQTLTEPDLFRSFWNDGLLDLLSGAALLVTGAGWALGLGALAAVQAPLWVVLWAPLRRRVVEPRAGFVRFSAARRQRTTGGLRWTLATGVAALLLTAGAVTLVALRGAPTAAPRLAAALPAVLVAVPAVPAAVLTGARRFHVYAIALLVAAALTVVLDTGPALPLVAVGLGAVAAGTVLLRRFLRASRAYRQRA